MPRTVPGERTIISASGAGSHRHQTAEEEEGAEERRGRGQGKAGERAESRAPAWGLASERQKHQPECSVNKSKNHYSRVGVFPRRPLKFESGHIKDLRL